MFPGQKVIDVWESVFYIKPHFMLYKSVLHDFYAFRKIRQELNILEQVTSQSVSISSLSH